MRDVLLALLALAGFGTFVGILAYEVPEPDLLIVIGVVMLFVVVDFARELWRKRG